MAGQNPPHLQAQKNIFREILKKFGILRRVALRVYERGNPSPAFAAAKRGETMNEPNRTQTDKQRPPFRRFRPSD